MTAKLAWAGIVGPLGFVALVVVQSVLQPDYSQVALPISALAAWPLGILQRLAFFVAGLTMIVFTVALEGGVRSSRRGWLATASMLVGGAGIVLAGVSSWQRVGADLVEPPAHAVGAITCFLGGALGLIGMSRRMAGDPAWQNLARYVLACGVAMLALFLLLATTAIPDDGPLHPWAGLVQRAVLVVWFPCLGVLAMRLRKLSRDGEGARMPRSRASSAR